MHRVGDSPDEVGSPEETAAEQAFRELELTARLAELDRSIRALERERDRFFRLRYSVDLLEAELLHLRAERADVRAQLRTWRAEMRPWKPARRPLSRRGLVAAAFASLALIGLAAMTFGSLGEGGDVPVPTPPLAVAEPAPAATSTVAGPAPTAVVSTPTPAAPDVRYALVVAEQLNVRLGAGLQYPIRRAVPAGTVLRLVRPRTGDAGDVWWELEQGGWVHSGYIRFAASEAEARAFAEAFP